MKFTAVVTFIALSIVGIVVLPVSAALAWRDGIAMLCFMSAGFVLHYLWKLAP